MPVFKQDKFPPHHPFAEGRIIFGQKPPKNWKESLEMREAKIKATAMREQEPCINVNEIYQEVENLIVLGGQKEKNVLQQWISEVLFELDSGEEFRMSSPGVTKHT